MSAVIATRGLTKVFGLGTSLPLEAWTPPPGANRKGHLMILLVIAIFAAAVFALGLQAGRGDLEE